MRLVLQEDCCLIEAMRDEPYRETILIFEAPLSGSLGTGFMHGKCMLAP